MNTKQANITKLSDNMLRVWRYAALIQSHGIEVSKLGILTIAYTGRLGYVRHNINLDTLNHTLACLAKRGLITPKENSEHMTDAMRTLGYTAYYLTGSQIATLYDLLQSNEEKRYPQYTAVFNMGYAINPKTSLELESFKPYTDIVVKMNRYGHLMLWEKKPDLDTYRHECGEYIQHDIDIMLAVISLCADDRESLLQGYPITTSLLDDSFLPRD